MDVQNIFLVLGIEETKNEAQIRAAYRDKLVLVNPEDNPEGFKRLREAYEEALAFARRKEDDEQGAAKDDPVSLFLQKLENIYRSLPKRLDSGEWERLVREDVLDDLDLGEDVKWGMFSYLAKYFRMPAKNWKILDRAFGIAENEREFKEHLHENFVDFMLRKIADETGSSDFPYEKFSGEDTADYDAFLEHLDRLMGLTGKESGEEDVSERKKEISQEIAFLDSLEINHPWFMLEKAKYSLICQEKQEAERIIRMLWESDGTDRHVRLSGAGILRRCGHAEEAAAAYQKLLEEADLSEEQIYTASVNMAEIFAQQGDMTKAREHALRAWRTYNTQKAADLMNQINTALIEEYRGEKAENMTPEEGIRLAWCYVQTERSAEGWAFLEEHPVLNADTAECHWAKAVMALESGRAEEAIEQAQGWRQCLLTADSESEEDKVRYLAQSFDLEGRALQMRYEKLADKEGEEAQEYSRRALAAFDEAIARMPRDIDYLMGKMLFCRLLHDYEQMAALCEQLKTLDGRLYWAYFYAQEAYEGLGRAQQVVDNFYRAKEIYAGHFEIYERAVKVFVEYRQYKDAKHILDQAEEAKVNSFYLMVKRLETLRRLAADTDELRAADIYAGQVIGELEEQKGPEDLLAEAYLERCLIHDDGRARSFRSIDSIEEWAKRAVGLKDIDRNRYFLGRFYYVYRDDAKKAYENLRVCEERGLTFAWLYYYIALCHEEFEQWEDALQYFKKAVELDPEEQDFRWRLVWRLRRKFIRTDQIEYCREALRYLEEQNEKFGETPRELWQASDLHSRCRENEKALDEINRALESNQCSRNWGHKGMLLERLGRMEEAQECYEKGIEVDWKEGKDYEYGYSQMYDYFCRIKDFEGGIAWFSKKLKLVKTEEQRRENLSDIKYMYIRLNRFEGAMEMLCQLHGNTDLTDYAGTSWEQEGRRIDDLLDYYQYCLRAECLSEEELLEKCREAEALLKNEGGRPLSENADGKRRAYMQLGFTYTDYLLDDERGLYFFQKALEQLDPEKEDDRSDYRNTLDNMMRCLHRMGDLKRAKECRILYLDALAEDYRDCTDLGLDTEEMLARGYGCERVNLYQLFCLYYFSGNYEKARMYAERIEESPWCRWCVRKGCTELWECKGYIAALDGKWEEALEDFKRANECAPRENTDAMREIRRIMKFGKINSQQ